MIVLTKALTQTRPGFTQGFTAGSGLNVPGFVFYGISNFIFSSCSQMVGLVYESVYSKNYKRTFLFYFFISPAVSLLSSPVASHTCAFGQ